MVISQLGIDVCPHGWMGGVEGEGEEKRDNVICPTLHNHVHHSYPCFQSVTMEGANSYSSLQYVEETNPYSSLESFTMEAIELPQIGEAPLISLSLPRRHSSPLPWRHAWPRRHSWPPPSLPHTSPCPSPPLPPPYLPQRDACPPPPLPPPLLPRRPPPPWPPVTSELNLSEGSRCRTPLVIRLLMILVFIVLVLLIFYFWLLSQPRYE